LDRPALLYVLRAPVLKVEVAGQKMFFAAVGEVPSRLELLELARDHLSLLALGEVEVAAGRPARLYDLLGSRLPCKVELRFAWFGFEVEEREPERRALVRFKIALRDGAWRRRRTIRAETAMEAFAAEALVWHDLPRGVRRARFSSAKLGRWVPTMTSHLGPFYNFDALREMPAEPPARFKVRAPRRGDAGLRSYLA
jgi:hypothetical protein